MEQTKGKSAADVGGGNTVPRQNRKVSNPQFANKIAEIPPGFWWLMGVLIFWGLFTANPLLTVGALLVPPLLVPLLWRPGEPPVLLFACFMQWAQAATGVFYENSLGHPLAETFGGHELAQATGLSLAGVMVCAVGARAALLRVPAVDFDAVELEAQNCSASRVFLIWLVLFGGSTMIQHVAFAIPSISQILFALTVLEWIPVVMLTQAVLTQRRGYGWLLLLVVIKFATGLLGYFSSFKSIFFVLAVLMLTWRGMLPKRRILIMAGVAGFLLIFGSGWQAIKSDYRTFLNQDTRQQVVLEPISARVQKLAELLAGFDAEKFTDGFDQVLQRISYVEFFAKCIQNVPANLPYEHGALWIGAVEHVFMPRMFFPNKRVLDDSAEAQKYTGMELAGSDEGASIGLGYMAESYVDFGPYFMFVPIFLLGIFYGLIYRCFIFQPQCRLIGIGCAIAILVFGADTIETSNVKLVGGNTMNTLVLGVCLWRFGPVLMSFASKPGYRQVRPISGENPVEIKKRRARLRGTNTIIP